MTEETNQVTEQQPNSGINISVEQILASILQTIGSVNVQLETLVANYGNKSISVNQQEDKSVTFTLIDNEQIPQEEAAE